MVGVSKYTYDLKNPRTRGIKGVGLVKQALPLVIFKIAFLDLYNRKSLRDLEH